MKPDMNPRVESLLAGFVLLFSKLTAEQLNACRPAITLIFKEIAGLFYGYQTHWDLWVSRAHNYFGEMRRQLQVWMKDKVFSSPQAVQVIAHVVIEVCLSLKEEEEDEHSWSRMYAGDLLRDLGFFEDALSYYRLAKKGVACGHKPEHLFELAKVYRASGQQTPSLEQMVTEIVSKIVGYCEEQMIREIYPFASKPELPQDWDRSLFQGRKWLGLMGFTEIEQHEWLRPVYEKAIELLSLKHETKMKQLAKDNVPWRERVAPYSGTITDLYKLIGDETNSLKWEMVMLKAKKNWEQEIIDNDEQIVEEIHNRPEDGFESKEIKLRRREKLVSDCRNRVNEINTRVTEIEKALNPSA